MFGLLCLVEVGCEQGHAKYLFLCFLLLYDLRHVFTRIAKVFLLPSETLEHLPHIVMRRHILIIITAAISRRHSRTVLRCCSWQLLPRIVLCKRLQTLRCYQRGGLAIQEGRVVILELRYRLYFASTVHIEGLSILHIVIVRCESTVRSVDVARPLLFDSLHISDFYLG